MRRFLVVLLGDLVALAALAGVAASFAGLPWLAAASRMVLGGEGQQPWWHFHAAVLLSLLVTKSYAGWNGALRRSDLLRACLLAVSLSFWGILPSVGVASILPPLAFTFALTAAILLAGRYLSRVALRTFWQGYGSAPSAVLVGTEEDFCAATEAEKSQDEFRLIGYVTVNGNRSSRALGGLEDLASLVGEHGIETILVADHLPDADLGWLVDVSQVAGCELLYPAAAVELAGSRALLVKRHGQPYFELGSPVLQAQQLLVKRILDVVGGLVGLTVLAPLFLFVAILVAFDSRGPILFAQHRAGIAGRRFRMLKFRTMRLGADAEKASLAHLNHSGDPRLFKIPNDPRITRVGSWLRRWSLDELPQLWNVLKGDMSLVGPRPFFESDLADYEAHHFRRLGVKPGVTGLWQVSGRSQVLDFEEVVRYDRQYIEQWSLWLDFRILFKTLPAMLRRTGAF